MSPELISLISDAIKILGPAIITGFVGYKAGKIQLDVKLKELEKTHEFSARQDLFKVYVERGNEIRKEEQGFYNGLNEYLNILVGFNANKNSDEEISELVKNIIDTFNDKKRLVPHSINLIRQEMIKYGLSHLEEFKLLNSCENKLEEYTEETSIAGFSKNVTILMEVYSIIYHCHQLIMESQSEKIFNKYIKNGESK